MTVSTLKGNIRSVTHAQHDEATDVLIRAFEQYPLMQYMFADQGSAYLHVLRALFHFSLQRRLAIGSPTLASVVADSLTGVAGLSTPDDKPPSDQEEVFSTTFARIVGEAAVERFEQYAQLSDIYRPLHPHITLGVLGVHPDHQGRGYGRILLDAVHALSEDHPTSTGVYLDTQVAQNVALYEHVGYRVLAYDMLDDVPMWFLFRPNRGF